MKAITMFIAMVTVLVFNTNAQNTDVKGLLDNEETRTEIFNAIAGDHQMMMDFMKVAKENEHGAMMMRDAENSKMKKMGSHKGGMMKENPEMMKMCMQKMKEKDMMDSDGKMMNMEEKSDNENHNH